MPKFSATTSNAEAASISTVGTVDHIFFQVPSTGDWEFWVEQFDEELEVGVNQNYAVAWWAQSAAGPSFGGDFNNDQMVDGADFAQWKGDFGETTGGGSDADGDGDSDGADFLAWQRDFGLPAAIAANQSVPEPAAWSLLAFGLPWLMRRRFVCAL